MSSNIKVIHSKTTIKGTTRWPVTIKYDPYVPREKRPYNSKGYLVDFCPKCKRRFATVQGMALHMEFYHDS